MSLRRCNECAACLYGDASDRCESPVPYEAAPVAIEDGNDEEQDAMADQYFGELESMRDRQRQ